MTEDRTYIVPAYYPDFACKCSACSNTCCTTWRIPISLSEYLKLLSVPCSDALRGQLDRAFHLADSPTPERYAVIAPRFDGTCPLLTPDGLCMLQYECGYETLSTICRHYPRGGRKIGQRYEAACANSCERTLELLFQLREPLAFIPHPLPDGDVIAIAHDDRESTFLPLRQLVFQILQNRSETLPLRIMRLGRVLSAVEENLFSANTEQPVVPGTDKGYGLSLQYNLLSLLAETSVSLAEEAEDILPKLGLQEEDAPLNADYYASCLAHLYAVLPEIDVYWEQLLVNHLYFETFPFMDKRETMWHAYMALCATFTVLKLIGACGMENKRGMAEFTRLMVHAFRAIEHSRFAHNAIVILMRENCTSQYCLDKLLMA